MKFLSVLLVAVMAVALTGCGGGGGGTVVNPPVDTSGPVFHSFTATYNYSSGDATLVANITDASGISTVRAFVNGASVGTDMLLSSANTYVGTYPNVPDNLNSEEVVYTVVAYATDTKNNTSTSTTTFTVPPFGPPPPPPDIN